MQKVEVALGQRSYPILVGNDLLDTLGWECQKLGLGGACAVITDTKVTRRYGERAMASLRACGFRPLRITIPSGERAKALRYVERCYDQLAHHRLERKSFIVALGGGVVGDLAGFVAATYLRGIDFVQIPTTLLAQVDSSVGGKVGINLKAGKNLVGAFYQPKLVLCDLSTLRTLPRREFRAGLAEVIKYGIIYDADFFHTLETDLTALLRQDPGILAAVVARCCQIKAEVVSQDETEGGLRAILNFGHSIGHALEAVLGYGTLLHGEAISIGQVAAAELSVLTCGLLRPEADRIRALFRKAGLPTTIDLTPDQQKRVRAAMALDKKVSGGEIKFVLASRIGKVAWGQRVSVPLIDRALAASKESDS